MDKDFAKQRDSCILRYTAALRSTENATLGNSAFNTTNPTKIEYLTTSHQKTHESEIDND
ncbi:hypothetical protein I6E29_03490 [Arcanobacterium haemolyticum]|nr:hypothetical protein [Arcanobacterium haemolyticum]